MSVWVRICVMYVYGDIASVHMALQHIDALIADQCTCIIMCIYYCVCDNTPQWRSIEWGWPDQNDKRSQLRQSACEQEFSPFNSLLATTKPLRILYDTTDITPNYPMGYGCYMEAF